MAAAIGLPFILGAAGFYFGAVMGLTLMPEGGSIIFASAFLFSGTIFIVIGLFMVKAIRWQVQPAQKKASYSYDLEPSPFKGIISTWSIMYVLLLLTPIIAFSLAARKIFYQEISLVSLLLVDLTIAIALYAFGKTLLDKLSKGKQSSSVEQRLALEKEGGSEQGFGEEINAREVLRKTEELMRREKIF